MFQVILKKENDYVNIIVQLVGSQETANSCSCNYKLEITRQDRTKMLTMTERCEAAESVATAFDSKGFSIRYKQLQQFSSSGAIATITIVNVNRSYYQYN